MPRVPVPKTYGPLAVGRWPQPVAVIPGPWDAGRWQLTAGRWPRIVGSGGRIGTGRTPSRWQLSGGHAARIVGRGSWTGRIGSAALGSGSRTPANGQGAPAYRVKPRFPAFRRRAAPRGPRARRTGARAMFLANIYLFFRIGFNCLIFAVKIAYITCYVPRETSKTAYQKLARVPYECSNQPGVRREKTEA